jgi:hypothetical protein
MAPLDLVQCNPIFSLRPSFVKAGKLVAGLVDPMIGKDVELVLAVNQSTQTFHDYLEEGIEGFEGCIRPGTD